MTAVLFDFNGTMFFDEKFQEMSWRQFVDDKIGRVITDDEFQKYIHGRNNDFTMRYFLEKSFLGEELEALEEEKEAIYRKLCLESEAFHLADGLADFLYELQLQCIPVNIATASGLKNVEFFFEHLDLANWFDISKVVYNDGELPGKPEPDLYLKAASNIGVDIRECIVFEDSLSGIESAKCAKAKSVVKVASMKKSKDKAGMISIIRDYTDMDTLMQVIKQ